MGWWQYGAMKSEVSLWYLTASLTQKIFNLDYASDGLESQLIPSQVTCVLCPPKLAFSTYPQIISVV
jgi:hypothetical protein